MTSSGEGGPIRPRPTRTWSGRACRRPAGTSAFTPPICARVRDVEIKINQGAKPGKGGRLVGRQGHADGEQGAQHPGRHRRAVARSQARHLFDRGHAGRSVAVAALPQPLRHQDHRLELHASTWRPACGRTSSSTTCWWTPGSAAPATTTPTPRTSAGPTSSAPSCTRITRWCTRRWTSTASGELQPIRDLNGAPFGAGGGTRLFASGGLRGELDMLKVLIAGADGAGRGAASARRWRSAATSAATATSIARAAASRPSPS